MKTIYLIGHLFEDSFTIVDKSGSIFNFNNTGGIGNCMKYFKDCKIEFNLQFLPSGTRNTCNFVITPNEYYKEVSYDEPKPVALFERFNKQTYNDNKIWFHIAYLDNLNIELPWLKNKFPKSKISADFALDDEYLINEYKLIKNMECIDLFFMNNSSNYIFDILKSGIIKGKKYGIIHEGNIISLVTFEDGKVKFHRKYEFEKNNYINTVGAGDYFAAACITKIFCLEMRDFILRKAHMETENMLKRLNEKYVC